jgi:hypothetical protein
VIANGLKLQVPRSTVPSSSHCTREFARLELPLLDLLGQLDSRDRYHRVVESLESQHRPHIPAKVSSNLYKRSNQVCRSDTELEALSRCDKFENVFGRPNRNARRAVVSDFPAESDRGNAGALTQTGASRGNSHNTFVNLVERYGEGGRHILKIGRTTLDTCQDLLDNLRRPF